MAEDTIFKKGQIFRDSFLADADLVSAFADFSKDYNPVHVDAQVARSYGYSKPFAHGVILTVVVSKIIGMKVPGPGAVWMSQNIEWLAPVFIGDKVEIEVVIARYSSSARVLELKISATNQNGNLVMQGTAKVKQGKKLSGSADQIPSEKVAIVTGGSRGIGAEIARGLANVGIRTAILYNRSSDEANRIVDEIKEGDGDAIAVSADLSKVGTAQAAYSEVKETFGIPNIVIHAASPPIDYKDILDCEMADFQRFHDVYLNSMHEMVRCAYPGMAEKKFGRIVFLGSSMLFQSAKKVGAYVTAKYAMVGYMRTLAFELGPHGITSNMVSPSMAITEFSESVPARMKEMEAAKSPIRRLVTPEDISGTVQFIVSDSGSYLNGVNLPLTGGSV